MNKVIYAEIKRGKNLVSFWAPIEDRGQQSPPIFAVSRIYFLSFLPKIGLLPSFTYK